jgi:hypothetical protein
MRAKVEESMRKQGFIAYLTGESKLSDFFFELRFSVSTLFAA